MPLSTSDPYYRAEIVPQSIINMATPLCTHYGVGTDAFGAKGNLFHAYGYHRSRQWILNSPDSRYGSNDYSVQRTLDRQGDARLISAFDFTPGAWGTAENRRRMVEITRRVYNAALRNDRRLANMFEFAGTLDGSTVVTFYCQGGGFKTPFDLTHLDHNHGSLYRGRAANDHTGIVQIMLGVDEEEDIMGASFAPITLEPITTSLNIPPVQAGGADPRPAWLNFCNETFGVPYALRIWYTTGNEVWTPLPGTNGGMLALRSGQRFSQELPAGTACLSITRKAVDDNGNVVEPTPELRTYDGHLTCAIERGAVKP